MPRLSTATAAAAGEYRAMEGHQRAPWPPAARSRLRRSAIPLDARAFGQQRRAVQLQRVAGAVEPGERAGGARSGRARRWRPSTRPTPALAKAALAPPRRRRCATALPASAARCSSSPPPRVLSASSSRRSARRRAGARAPARANVPPSFRLDQHAIDPVERGARHQADAADAIVHSATVAPTVLRRRAGTRILLRHAAKCWRRHGLSSIARTMAMATGLPAHARGTSRSAGAGPWPSRWRRRRRRARPGRWLDLAHVDAAQVGVQRRHAVAAVWT